MFCRVLFCLGLALLCVTASLRAQVKDDLCFPYTRAAIYPGVSIWRSYDSSERLGWSPMDKLLHISVERSALFRGICYVKPEEIPGWIKRDALIALLHVPTPTPEATYTATPTPTQDNNKGPCYPATGIEVFRRTRAHSRYWSPQWDSKAVALRLGERFAVQSSTAFEGVCWIKTRAGWIQSGYVVPAQPPDATVTIVPTRKDKDAPCYANAGIRIAERTTVRANYWLHAATDGKVPVGEIFIVRSSRWNGSDCWIKTDSGWISAKAVDAVVPPTPLPPSCYTESYVYLAGQMNIRQSHTVNSSLIGQTKAGDLFEVKGTFTGTDYCWIRIKSGWIARLGVVSSLDSIPLPRIKGDERFRVQITGALDYLKKQLPDWYIYVVTNTRSIGRSTEYNRSTADGSIKHTAIAAKHLFPPIYLASVLIHEACHMVQWDRGDRYYRPDYRKEIRREKECLRIQRDMMQDYDPNHRLVDQLTEMISWSDGEWLMNVRP